MSGTVFLALSYGLGAVFAAAFIYRVAKMAALPVHLRWELAPVPHEKGKSGYGGSYFEEYEWWTKPREKSLFDEFKYMFKEIVFLRAMWENNRRMWWFSFPFHFGMYLLAALVGLTSLCAAAALFGMNLGPAAPTVLTVFAAGGYGLGLLGALGLLFNRLTDSKLKPFSTFPMFFNLLLLSAVFASGGWALATTGTSFAADLVNFGRALPTADTALLATVSGPTTRHLVLALLFLAYLPFTQMMHFAAKYFTYHEVRWNDEPMAPDSSLSKQTRQLLGQPVGWAAPHLNTDGKKNWVDVATEETKK